MANDRVAEVFPGAKPYVLMVALQLGSAEMYIISTVSLDQGMSRYALIVYRNSIATLVLAPFAFLLERKIWPKMTLSVFLQIMVLGFLESKIIRLPAPLGDEQQEHRQAEDDAYKLPVTTTADAKLDSLPK